MSEGQMEITKAFDMENAEARKVAEKAIQMTEAIRRCMSPPGALNLPPLLEKRRQEYGITDGAFKRAAQFDRIYVFQIAMNDGPTFVKDGRIFMPETAKKRVREEAARGIVISAGLKALDNLRSNGTDLGHIVNFARLSPYRIPSEHIDGVEQHIMVLRDGDIIGDEDLEEQRRAGLVAVEQLKLGDGSVQHVLRYADTERPPPGSPTMPWMPDDY